MHRRSNPSPSPGDQLRDHAADLLSSQFGEAKTEVRADGKKVDVFFEYNELGRKVKLFLEAKDYSKPLGRTDVVHIRTDYEGILRKNSPAILLVVTRSGLTPDAQIHIEEEIDNTRHQTIWEIEAGLIDLESYLRHLMELFDSSGLSNYYVENGFSVREPQATEHEAHVANTRSTFDQKASCFEALSGWCSEDADNTPVAILGGYGTGKTSLATRLAAHLASKALYDAHARQPIVIKLGEIFQYANIEGLLGGYFTKTFPIKNFNFYNFLRLNKKGRFVIILDGFDEMKHSMSWSDFKAQVKSLLLLHDQNSKIILLGRPSAFLSETEERYILKGERPFGDSWVMLPDWPRFHELEIKNFSDSQREEFITRYLATIAENQSEQTTKQRAQLTNEIASEDPKLYEKPVHSKILTDLARDPNFDLTQFRSTSSRWLLYQEFISSLYNREAEKRTRSDISTKKRITFLGELAFWLWTERGASISFRADDIPKNLYGVFGSEDEDERLALCRELLVGSILERKTGNTFFFGHRSFAEFIVADYLSKNAPTSENHEKYSSVFRDGVREFLVESPHSNKVKEWSKTFDTANGQISQAYIDFLARPFGSIEHFLGTLSVNSHWQPILHPFKHSLIPNKENYHTIKNKLSSDIGLAFAWHYCWLTQLDNEGWRSVGAENGMGSSSFDRHIMVSLLNALFSKLVNIDKNLFVSSENVGLRKICHDAVKRYEFDDGKSEFEWSHHKLGAACVKELQRNDIAWETDLSHNDRIITTSADDIFNKINKTAQNNLLTFIKNDMNWSNITERSTKTRRRREAGSSKKRYSPTKHHYQARSNKRQR